jgi:hypothetical protein
MLDLNTPELLEGKVVWDANILEHEIKDAIVKIAKAKTFKKDDKPETLLIEYEVLEGIYQNYVKTQFYDIEEPRVLPIIRAIFISAGFFEIKKNENGEDRYYVPSNVTYQDLVGKKLNIDFVFNEGKNGQKFLNAKNIRRYSDDKPLDYGLDKPFEEENPFNA